MKSMSRITDAVDSSPRGEVEPAVGENRARERVLDALGGEVVQPPDLPAGRGVETDEQGLAGEDVHAPGRGHRAGDDRAAEVDLPHRPAVRLSEAIEVRIDRAEVDVLAV